MAVKGTKQFKSARAEQYLVTCQVTTANTSAPTLAPAYASTDLVAARTGVGAYKLTFGEWCKPASVAAHSICVLGDEPDLFAKVVSYTASTGILVFKLYTNTAGTIAAADTTSKVYSIILVCSRSAVTGGGII